MRGSFRVGRGALVVSSAMMLNVIFVGQKSKTVEEERCRSYDRLKEERLARCDLEEERWLPATFGFAAGRAIVALLLVVSSCWIGFLRILYVESC